MTACTMPPPDKMEFFEQHVNSPEANTHRPNWPGEVLEFVLPTNLSSPRSKARHFTVAVVFSAEYWSDGLRWRYAGVRVTEAV